MLLAVILELRAARACALPAALGRAHYAQTLAWIEAVDPRLSAAVHDAQAKPLTCSPLLDAPPPARDGKLHLAAGQGVRVRLTTLTPALSTLVAHEMNVRPPARWPLHGCDFEVISVICDPTVDPSSGMAFADEMAAQALLGASRPPSSATLEYLTPVAFKSMEMQMPLPLPGLVWGGLAARWNALYPDQRLDDEARRFAEEAVAVSSFRLQSEAVRLAPDALVIGAVGSATYRALTDDRYWLGVFQLLADFAFYAGVGMKTALGCGQCRRRKATERGERA